MGLVSKVGRKRPRARLALVVLYVLLCLGAITTVGPFVLMVSGGMRGASDQEDARPLPAYFSDFDSPGADGLPSPQSLMGKYLADKYAGDKSWMRSSAFSSPRNKVDLKKWEEQLMLLPADQWLPGFRTVPNQVSGKLAMRYQGWLRNRYGDIDRLNVAYIEENTAFQTVQPPAEMLDRPSWNPPDTRKYREWLEFKAALPAEFRIPILPQRLFQEYLRAKFRNRLDCVPNDLLESDFEFETITLPDPATPEATIFAGTLPARLKRNPFFAEWLRTGSEPFAPLYMWETEFVRTNADSLRREFAGRNFLYVFDYVALHGRALLNTVIFCLLAIAVQLIVNPLAAYALSRYPNRHTGRVLLFLLATMAFPAEVAMIPSFLLLKDLGLLNTFAALVLPTAASGYMIFLLKGFFDSLPKELFESAQLDGAPETTMMMRIALPLSRPVLGYLALLAFMGAYGSFLYAFLVAQDQRIWTLMVWVYQLQNAAPKAVVLAAVSLVALPTLVVFLLAQRVIARGIVLPGER